ncbi:MAG: hypothetical protein WC242_04995 [Candidatus Paceibacterota bacterium]
MRKFKVEKTRIHNVFSPGNRYPFNLFLETTSGGSVVAFIDNDSSYTCSSDDIRSSIEEAWKKLTIVLCQNKNILGIAIVAHPFEIRCSFKRENYEGDKCESFIAIFLADLRKNGWIIPDYYIIQN